MAFFATLEYIERIRHQLELPGENSLKIAVEERKFICYLYVKRGHMRIQCTRYKSQEAEEETRDQYGK